MLQTNRTDDWVNRGNMPPEFPSTPAVSLAEMVRFVRRHLLIISLSCFVTLGIGIFYLVTAVPTFTAKAELVINARGSVGDATSVSTIVETQIGIIKSESIARAVIKKLALAEDQKVARQDSVVHRMTSSISRRLGWSKPKTKASAKRHFLESFEHRLSAKRVGSTYLVEVTFVSQDPDRAAQILNAIIEQYIAYQIDKPPLGDQTWAKDRLNELRTQASAAQRAFESHRNNKDTADSTDTLAKLAAAAKSSQNAYVDFNHVLRQMEADQQQSSPVFAASVVAEASPPSRASSPKPKIALGISIVGGLLLGIAIGMLRDLSRGIRTTGQEARLGVQDDGIERPLPDVSRPEHQSEPAKARPVRLTGSG